MSTSISIKELKELDPSSYQIVDIRDAVEISQQKDDYLLQPRPVQCRSGGRITGKGLGRCEPGGRLHRLADGCDERAGGAGQGATHGRGRSEN